MDTTTHPFLQALHALPLAGRVQLFTQASEYPRAFLTLQERFAEKCTALHAADRAALRQILEQEQQALDNEIRKLQSHG